MQKKESRNERPIRSCPKSVPFSCKTIVKAKGQWLGYTWIWTISVFAIYLYLTIANCFSFVFKTPSKHEKLIHRIYFLNPFITMFATIHTLLLCQNFCHTLVREIKLTKKEIFPHIFEISKFHALKVHIQNKNRQQL